MTETMPMEQVSQASPPTRNDLIQLLRDLYAKQIQLDPTNAYILEHGQESVISNQVRTFEWYRPYLAEGGNVLDWGCNHAPDSCLLRSYFGERINLWSSDFTGPEHYPVFHSYARPIHHPLTELVQIPYPTHHFDTVIASGVLEHCAMDYESLKELHRILKPDGVLAISYLPNRLSVGEWYLRRIKKSAFHRRLYGKREICTLLKRSGFYPTEVGYHTYFWERVVGGVGLQRWEKGLSKLLRRTIPIDIFSSTFCIIARKVHHM